MITSYKCQNEKGKGTKYLTSVVPSVTRLVSIEVDCAPFYPPPSVGAPFHGYLKLNSYTDQRKVKDTEYRKFRKSRFKQLSHASWLSSLVCVG